MKILSSKEFEEEVLKGGKKVLVDFFATWCGPCKMLAPILDQLQGETDVEIVKVDIDESMDLAKKFGIMSVPTMILFENGEEKDRIVGLRQKSQILSFVNN